MVIDRSGSMGSGTVTPDNSAIRNHPQFNGLDNVLGVVFEAAYKYICERCARSLDDLVTFIPFDDNVQVCFASAAISNVAPLLDHMMHIKPAGGTMFGQALVAAHSSIRQVWTLMQCGATVCEWGVPKVMSPDKESSATWGAAWVPTQ
jgi:hypothetical protein